MLGLWKLMIANVLAYHMWSTFILLHYIPGLKRHICSGPGPSGLNSSWDMINKVHEIITNSYKALCRKELDGEIHNASRGNWDEIHHCSSWAGIKMIP